MKLNLTKWGSLLANVNIANEHKSGPNMAEYGHQLLQLGDAIITYSAKRTGIYCGYR